MATTLKVTLTDDWQKVLDDEMGFIKNGNSEGIKFYVGSGDDNNCVTLFNDNVNFASKVTMFAKNYRFGKTAVLEVIKL